MTEDNASPEAGARVQDAGTRSFYLDPHQNFHLEIHKKLPPNDEAEAYYWFPMYVKYRKELAVQQELETHDFHTFIPMERVQLEEKGKVRFEMQPAVHNLIFIHSFHRRVTWMKMFNKTCQRLQYMSRPKEKGGGGIMIVPDKEMENIIRAANLDDPDGQRSYIDHPLELSHLDRRIRFVKGPFKGIEGIIKRVRKNRAMVIPLAKGISMKITITSAADIEFL